MNPLISSFFFITMAEMGDKTQLVALAFAGKYKARKVITGIFVATLLVHLLSVVIGQFLGDILPIKIVKIIAGISFILFGLWTLRGDTLDEDEENKKSRFGPIITVGIAFFLAELGDKTQLATITLAAQYKSFIQVWIGSTLGMVIADGLAIIVGTVLGKALPAKLIKLAAVAIFIFFGIFTLYEVL